VPIIEARTAPLYAAAIGATLERVRTEPDARPLALWGSLALRQGELSLSQAAADAVLGAQIEAITRPLADALASAASGRDDRATLSAARALLAWGAQASTFVTAMASDKVASDDDIAGLCRSYIYGGAATSDGGARETLDRLSAAAARLDGALSADELAKIAELVGIPADAGASAHAAEGARRLREAFDAACERAGAPNPSDGGFEVRAQAHAWPSPSRLSCSGKARERPSWAAPRRSRPRPRAPAAQPAPARPSPTRRASPVSRAGGVRA
jgi:hypothetical protein